MTDMLLGVKCGCQVRQYTRLIQDDVGADGLAIVYCPKHAAADDLLEALEKIVGLAPISIDKHIPKVALLITGSEIQKVAKAAIAQVVVQD